MKCPNPACKRDWLYDWESNVYRTRTGTPCKTSGRYGSRKGLLLHCTCGQLLGRLTVNKGMVDEPAEWQDVDWEAPENCY